MNQAAVESRFWSKVNKYGPMPNDTSLGNCWTWTGSQNDGYGIFTIGQKKIRAHRFAFQAYRENLYGDLDCCHKCDNGLCVRPSHLFAGTRKDNMHDASKKGRIWNAKKGFCKRGHALTEDNLVASKRGYRICKTCHNTQNRNWRATQ